MAKKKVTKSVSKKESKLKEISQDEISKKLHNHIIWLMSENEWERWDFSNLKLFWYYKDFWFEEWTEEKIHYYTSFKNKKFRS